MVYIVIAGLVVLLPTLMFLTLVFIIVWEMLKTPWPFDDWAMINEIDGLEMWNGQKE